MKATITKTKTTTIPFHRFVSISILLASISSVCSAFVVRSPSSFHHTGTLLTATATATATTRRQSTTAMAASASSFANFLAQQKPLFDENNKLKLKQHHHLIIGNPAGDADSIISALALAHVDHLLSSATKVPIVSIPRADMTLRRETVLLLEMLNISTETLLYLDDLIVTEESVTGNTVTLVDHNQLVYPALLAVDKHQYDVVEILDHHFDEQAHIDQVTDTNRNIAFLDNTALVASTCTLVVERWLLNNNDDNDGTTTKMTIPADLSFALLAVILLDTVNMSPAAGKGTVRDETAMTALMQQTDWSSLSQQDAHTKEFFNDNGEPNCTKLYNHLSDSKFDIDFWKSLSVTDALRLDYKQFLTSGDGAFGAASVLLPLADFLANANWETQVLQYMSDCDIPILVVLSMVIVDDTPQRSLLICGTDIAAAADADSSLVNHLQTTESLQLAAVPITSRSEKLVVHQFLQGNAKASRKQVVPIILDYYDKK